jgi:hypothetical protein
MVTTLVDQEFLMQFDQKTTRTEMTGEHRHELNRRDVEADRVRAALRSEIAANLRRLGVAMNVEVLADMVEAGAV